MPKIAQKVKGGDRVFNSKACVLSPLVLCSSFIRSFNKYLMNSYYVSSVLYTGKAAMRKQTKISVLGELSF